jgi:hypothetical protein
MMEPWAKGTTEEERSRRLFKDALMRYSVEHPWSFLSDEAEEAAELAAAKVESAYARVREHAPEVLKGDALPAYARILSALRTEPGRLRALCRRAGCWCRCWRDSTTASID